MSNELMKRTIDEISPYDSQYPIRLLEEGIARQIRLAQDAAEKIYDVVSKTAPIASQLAQATQKTVRYVVDTSGGVLEGLESGSIKLITQKDGRMTAQLWDTEGKRFGKKLEIKREVTRKGIDPTEMANALQMMALQEQLQLVTEQIVSIDNSVKDVLLGQQNDRLGLYYSGLALYLEARSMENDEWKRALLSQALRSLSDASFQLIVTMQSDIKYLVDGKYALEKGKQRQLMDERMSNIHKAFEFVHQATMLKAAIYCEQNEVKAMTTTLNEYARFIESTIVQNANLLSQCDQNDDGTIEGVWQRRAQLKLDMSEIQKQLGIEEKVMYIGVAEE